MLSLEIVIGMIISVQAYTGVYQQSEILCVFTNMVLSFRFYLPLPATEAMWVIFVLYRIASQVSRVVVVQARCCECLLQNVCVCGVPVDDLAHLQKFS